MTEHSETLGALAAALAKAQAAMPRAAENATNPFFRSKYADLGSVWEAARQPMADNGLSVVQFPTSGGSTPVATREPAAQKGEPDKLVVIETATIGLTTMLLHESGEWISNTIYLPVTEEKGRSLAQGAGSIISYLRRYGLSAALGIVTGEDNEAEPPQRQQATQRKAAPKTAANGNGDEKPFYSAVVKETPFYTSPQDVEDTMALLSLPYPSRADEARSHRAALAKYADLVANGKSQAEAVAMLTQAETA